MEYGIDFVERIRETIAQCQIILVIVGPHWFSEYGEPSRYARTEVERALDVGIQVIPMLVCNATMPSREQLPPTLRRLSLLNVAIVPDGRDFHRDMQDLKAVYEVHEAKSNGVG